MSNKKIVIKNYIEELELYNDMTDIGLVEYVKINNKPFYMGTTIANGFDYADATKCYRLVSDEFKVLRTVKWLGQRRTLVFISYEGILEISNKKRNKSEFVNNLNKIGFRILSQIHKSNEVDSSLAIQGNKTEILKLVNSLKELKETNIDLKLENQILETKIDYADYALDADGLFNYDDLTDFYNQKLKVNNRVTKKEVLDYLKLLGIISYSSHLPFKKYVEKEWFNTKMINHSANPTKARMVAIRYLTPLGIKELVNILSLNYNK
jgi:phage antirepressor YoqD-like protein